VGQAAFVFCPRQRVESISRVETEISGHGGLLHQEFAHAHRNDHGSRSAPIVEAA
jgi:hypothetical protein